VPKEPREATMRATWLCHELRALRESRGISAKEIGAHLGKAQSTISRLESGLFPPQESEVVAYLDFCGVTDRQRRAEFFMMCDEAAQQGWWDGYAGNVASSLMDRAWIESHAAQIRTFDMTVIPGLLQTPEYAAALFSIGAPEVTEKGLQRWLDFRMTRQHITTRHHPVQLHCLIEEHALQLVTGDHSVMAQQLDFLSTVGQLKNVTLQLLPTGYNHGVTSSFEVMEPQSPYPRVGYVATQVGDLCVEGEEVDHLSRTYDRLLSIALSPEASEKRIIAAREKL
jgi:transcriptional regulator with XRE-family HTH domain